MILAFKKKFEKIRNIIMESTQSPMSHNSILMETFNCHGGTSIHTTENDYEMVSTFFFFFKTSFKPKQVYLLIISCDF